MHRFYVTERLHEAGQTVTLPREECEHLSRVLRLRAGEPICLLDGQSLCAATLVEVGDKLAQARVDAFLPSPEAPAQALLLQGLPKADKLELITQKATELGMWELWPVEMERCVARADKAERGQKKLERLSRIALEAAKQSGRAHVPTVAPVRTLAQALGELQEPTLTLVAWEEEHALPLSQAVRRYISEHGAPKRVALIIGPEGGISREEYALMAQVGAVSVTLGPRILRTETAGLCALSVLWTALGEM